MSQSSIDICDYDPILFGHPHKIGRPQLTEPFWNQYPTWAPPYQLAPYNPFPFQPNNNYYKYTMSETVIIGSKSKYASKRPDKSTPGPDSKLPRAKGKVDVYVDGKFIQEVPLVLLVRFSTAAQDAFPKPVKTGASEKQDAVRDWAEDDGQKVDVTQLTSDMARLNTPSEGPPVDTSDNHTNKKLDLYSDKLWIQPPFDAFKFAFDWMETARRTSVGDQVLAYGVPDPDKLALSKLVDLYAAALALRLRPPPAKLRGDLFTRLTNVPPSISDVVYIHEHLPIDDRVMTRMITSFLQNRGASQEVYTKAERDEIEDYFNYVDSDLYSRYTDVVKYREEKKKYYSREKGAAKLQKLAEGSEGNANVEEVVVNGAVHKSLKDENVASNDGGHRRNRGKQQETGKGANGKSVSI